MKKAKQKQNKQYVTHRLRKSQFKEACSQRCVSSVPLTNNLERKMKNTVVDIIVSRNS